ncbi:MAG: alpha-hydroxy-acid oxidizing protein [Acidobacteria bacterium]|nr:alpha-hydroxy-acid oxidizing protein [Acidobacteriota bacterium]
MLNRREALWRFACFVAGSPLFAQRNGTIYPPAYSDEVMAPVNLHEIEEAAKKKIHKLAYDFIAGGVEDELTLRGNREALARVWLRPRSMVDVSKIDPSLELLGKKMDYPIILAPTGGKNLVIPDGDRIAAEGAHATKALYCVAAGGWIEKLSEKNEAPVWWQNTIGHATKSAAQAFARRTEDAGASAIVITVDNQYLSNRDRNNRNRFDYGYMQTGVPEDRAKVKPRSPAVPAMLEPHTPSMTWDYIDWLRSASSLPVILKGILNAEDARLAVERGAQAIVVSNHGGRQLDGVVPTIVALPEVVDAVGGKIPVLMDGGIRRGSDILKALALGAKAVQIGRPYVFGLAAFGKVGVQRVVELLRAELVVSMGLAGTPTLASIQRSLVRLP